MRPRNEKRRGFLESETNLEEADPDSIEAPHLDEWDSRYLCDPSSLTDVSPDD